MQFSEQQNGDVTLVRLKGRMDAASSPAIDTEVSRLLGEEASKLIMNFKEVDYLSSAGMRVILAASKKLTGRGGKLVLTELTPEVMDVLKMAGFDRILEITATEQEALSSF